MGNRKLNRRQLIRIGTLGLAGLGLGACTGATATTAPAAGAPAPAAAEPVVIKWAHYFDPLQSPAQKFNFEWMESMASTFEADHPEIKVEPEYFDWDKIDDRAILDFEAGIKHDVVFGSPQLMAKHFQVGDFIDLAPYIAGWSDEEKGDLAWSPVWASGSSGDVQIAVPTGVHTRSLAYRRDMFEAAGLDPDAPLASLDDCLAAAQALTTDDVYGLGMYFGPSRGTIELYFGPLIWHFGGELWDPETKEASFASEAGIQAAQFIHDLVYTHGVTPESSVGGTYDDAILVSFLEGRIAMGWGFGSYWIVSMEEGGFVNGCFPATDACAVDTGGVMVTPTAPGAQFTNGWTLSVHALSEHPQEAFTFMEHLIKPDSLYNFPDAGLPARLSLWDRPEFKSDFYQTWLEAAGKGKPMPPTVHYPELADTAAACLQEILVMEQSVEDTLTRFQDEYNSKYAGK